MKKAIYVLLLAALLSGCGNKESNEASEVPVLTVMTESAAETAAFSEPSAPAASTKTMEPTEAEIPEETLELSYDAYQVVYNIMTEGGEESAEFQGIGPDGDLIWTYETGSYPLAQLSRIVPLGRYQNQYYLMEGTGIVALDVTSGGILFENPDFTGSPCPDAILIDDYGYLYLAGYDGPDFFAMDPHGHTVKNILSISEDYHRPIGLELSENQITVFMESDAQGNSGNFPCQVDIDWLPQAKG